MKFLASIYKHYFKKNYIFLFGIIIVILSTRLIQANLFPAALTHDELVYAAQAKAISLTGKTLNQEYFPWSLQPLHPMYAELPGIFMVPFFLLFKNPLLATRGLSLVMGLAFPFVIGWFFYEWFRDKKIAYVSIIVASVNPLLWQMSRLMYDAPFTVLFNLLGGAAYLRAKSRGLMLFSFLALVIGFFGYQGYKLLFLPWVVLLIWKKSHGTLKKLGKLDWVFGIVCIGFFALYCLYILPHQNIENRFSNTIFASKEFLASQVNDERRLTLTNPVAVAFSNKYTLAAKFMIDKFVGAFNSKTLFWAGEPSRSAFAAWGHGWFYVVDFVLLILGLVSLGLHKKLLKPGLALISFIIFATLPSLVNSGNSWYLLRMFFPNVLLLGIMSAGFIFLARSRFLLSSFTLLYVLFVLYFGYFYLFRYPILGQNTSYLSERVVIDYVSRVKKSDPDIPIYIHTVDVPVMIWSYLIYSDYYSRDTAQEFAQAIRADTARINGILFTTSCADLSKPGVVINESWRATCEPDRDTSTGSLSVPSIIDNGTYWNIYNDSFCSDRGIKNYIKVTSFNEFNIKNQSNENFCSQWLARFN